MARANYQYDKKIEAEVRRLAREGMSRKGIFDLLSGQGNFQNMPGSHPTFLKHYEWVWLEESAYLVSKATGTIHHHLEDANLDAAKFVLERRGGSDWQKVDATVNLEVDLNGDEEESARDAILEALGMAKPEK
jgi:hypothetical protein